MRLQQMGCALGEASNIHGPLSGSLLIMHVVLFTTRYVQRHITIQHCLAWYAGDYKAGEVVGGRYEMQEVIGQGSSGVTYKAGLPIIQNQSLATWKHHYVLSGDVLCQCLVTESQNPGQQASESDS